MTWTLEDNHGCADLPASFEPNCRADLDRIPEIKAWCVEQFGISKSGPENRWFLFSTYFAFYDPVDAMAFKMRWG